MPSWFHKKKSGDLKLENREEIIRHIHKIASENPEAFVETEWECSNSEDDYRAGDWLEERRKWSDAAFEGDWDGLLKLAAEAPDAMGRFSNARRLYKASALLSKSKTPSGYTALHQAAFHNAPEEVVRALVTLGCYRHLHTTDGRNQRPVDIARERGFLSLVPLLEPSIDLIPHISNDELVRIQKHFMEVVIKESHGCFKPETMSIVDLTILREVNKVWMPIAGMYGGFNIRFEGDHLISESACRVVGGSGMTYHITGSGAILAAEGWG